MLVLPELNIHHGNQRIPPRQPLLRLLRQSPDTTHHPRLSRLNNRPRIQPQRIAIVTIKISGEGTPSFIAEVVRQGFEFTAVVRTVGEFAAEQVD